MRVADVKSLFWLSRWYNGRADRFQELHDKHLSNLVQLVIAEGGSLLQGENTISLAGFEICLSYDSSGLRIISIEPPQLLDGIQLDLFEEENQIAEAIA